MNNPAYPRIAFIGGGNMARALIGALLRLGAPAAQLRVGEPDAAVRAALEHELGVATAADNLVAMRGAALVVLAVKPQAAAAVLQGLRAALQELRPVLLSIVAGLRTAELIRVCTPAVAIVRAMPNRAALIGAGVSALYAPDTVSQTQRNIAERVTGAAGRTVWVRSEAELDVVTAVSGSGPAYFFLLAEQLARAGEALGLEPATALMLAGETLYGAGALTRGNASLAEQRAAVSSRGGTTEAALRALEAGGFDTLIARAVRAAAERSVELADNLAMALRAPPAV